MTEIADAAGSAAQRYQARPREGWNDDAGFYLVMVLTAVALLLAGFAPSFYLKSLIHAPPPLSLLTITHGVVFTTWMALFVAQAALIAARRPAPHRQLGMLGALLFGAMIVLGCSTALTAGRLGHAPPGSPAPLAFMALPLISMAGATTLVASGLLARRRIDWHKRLMLASLFAVTGPGTHRVAVGLGLAEHGVLANFLVADLLLLVAILYDWRRRRSVYPAYLASAGVFLGVACGVYWAFASDAWLAFARVLTQAA